MCVKMAFFEKALEEGALSLIKGYLVLIGLLEQNENEMLEFKSNSRYRYLIH